jgi:hypothetical protein
MSDEATPIDEVEVRQVEFAGELYREVYIHDTYIGRVKVEPS